MDGELAQAFRRLRAAAQGLSEVEESTSYGTPALKCRGKLLCRLKEASTAVVACPPDEKEMLLQVAPDIYFETDHYKGWPAILVRLDKAGADDLRYRLERAWLMQAPKRLSAGYLVGRT